MGAVLGAVGEELPDLVFVLVGLAVDIAEELAVVGAGGGAGVTGVGTGVTGGAALGVKAGPTPTLPGGTVTTMPCDVSAGFTVGATEAVKVGVLLRIGRFTDDVEREQADVPASTRSADAHRAEALNPHRVILGL